MEHWMTMQMLPWVVLLSFLPGLCVGSFLNVCIYRWPREMSVNVPNRSFCPGCERTLRWFENVPVVSWLVQGGRCRGCAMAIPLRYPVVELATAILFSAVTAQFWMVDPKVVVPFWIFVSLLIVGTVVDVQFYLLPDQTTLGMAAVGIVCSALVPELHGSAKGLGGLASAVTGAVLGFSVLWVVAELGKRFLGTVRHDFSEPVTLEWRRTGEVAEIRFEGETSSWNELFARKSDRVRLVFRRVRIEFTGGRSVEMGEGESFASLETLEMGGERFDLNRIDAFEGEIAHLSLPREAMGFGDVKLMAGIGAFLGWKGAVVAVFGGACVGTVWAVLASLVGRREWAARIPFGPFLSIAAVAWLFFSERLEPFLERFRVVWDVIQTR